MVFNKVNAAFSDWRHLSVQWRRLMDVLWALWAIIAWDSVANLAALAALTGLLTGSARYVRSLRATFIYDASSVAVPDGITIVGNPDGGNWIRQATENPSWSMQAAWFINPTGSDEASGATALAPIKTWAEFKRRVEPTGIAATMLVTIQSSLPPADIVSITASCVGTGSLSIIGTVVDAFEDAVVTYTRDVGQVGPNNNDIGSLEGGIIAAANVGSSIRFTSGDYDGAETWLLSEIAANTLRVNIPAISAGGFGFPVIPPGVIAPGDTFVVQDLSEVTVGQITVFGQFGATNVRLSHLAVKQIDAPFEGSQIMQTNGSATVCYLDWVVVHGEIFSFNNSCGNFTAYDCQINAQLGGFDYLQVWRSRLDCQYNLVIQGGLPNARADLAVIDSSTVFIGLELAEYGMQSPLLMYGGTHVEMYGAIVGTDNGAVSSYIELHEASQILGDLDAAPPTITPDQVTFGDGAALASTQLPYMAVRTGDAFYDVDPDNAVMGLGGTRVDVSGTITSTGAAQYLLPDGTESAVGAGPDMPPKAWLITSTCQLRGLQVLADAVPAADLTVQIYHIPRGTLIPALTALSAVITNAGASRQASANAPGPGALMLEEGDMLVVSHNNSDALTTALSVAIET